MESQPGSELREVWAALTPEEARELLAALLEWEQDSPPDPDWHVHIGGPESELTIGVVW